MGRASSHLLVMDVSSISIHFACHCFGLPGICVRGIPLSFMLSAMYMSALCMGEQEDREHRQRGSSRQTDKEGEKEGKCRRDMQTLLTFPV